MPMSWIPPRKLIMATIEAYPGTFMLPNSAFTVMHIAYAREIIAMLNPIYVHILSGIVEKLKIPSNA